MAGATGNHKDDQVSLKKTTWKYQGRCKCHTNEINQLQLLQFGIQANLSYVLGRKNNMKKYIKEYIVIINICEQLYSYMKMRLKLQKKQTLWI